MEKKSDEFKSWQILGNNNQDTDSNGNKYLNIEFPLQTEGSDEKEIYPFRDQYPVYQIPEKGKQVNNFRLDDLIALLTKMAFGK